MKRMKSVVWFNLIIALLTGGLLLFSGCEKNSTEPPEPGLELSKAATEGLVSGWQTLHSVSSVNKMDRVVSDGVPVNEEEAGGIYSKSQLRAEVAKLQKEMGAVLAKQSFGKITGDSLIWFVDWTDPVTGASVRKALYYNDSTGHARYYEAVYRFPGQVRLQYDSTEFRVDLNFTLNNSTDDRFLSLHKFTQFKAGFQVDHIEASAVATDYGPGNEVTGAILNNAVWYGAQSQLDKLTQVFELHPDESGHIEERLDYRDGTFLQRMVNFYADYTGEFSETWRNGTTVTGTFDRLEDDNHAAFTQIVNFPAGHNPQRLEQSAEVTLNPTDSSSSAIFKEKIHFAGGLLDTTRLDVQEFWENGLKKTHLESWRSSGAHADLLISHYEDYQEIAGNFTTPEGYFILVNATNYNDGSGELWLKIYESETAYNNGEPPIATIYIHYNADGSGAGEMTEQNQKYHVSVAPGGQMTVSDQEGHSQEVSGF